jgi:TRAP-type transport system periplasmic protein
MQATKVKAHVRLSQSKTTRRTLIRSALALPLVGILPKGVRAAEFNYKFATALQGGHPLNVRASEAFVRIREATHGQVEIKLFPANVLGSDADTLTQTRTGAVEFMVLGHGNLGNYVRSSGILSTGFAFSDYSHVWAAVDGALGDHIRDDINKTGTIVAVARMWDNGFRQVTSSSRPIRLPADLAGFKLRVPPTPAYTMLFNAFHAGPTPINYSDLYTSLQTHIVDGEENPLAIINSGKLYEVQKYCSFTNHIWDGFWLLSNQRAWMKLPSAVRTIVTDEFNRSIGDQRSDIAASSVSLRSSLGAKGLQFIDVDQQAFRAALSKTSFYRDWQQQFDPKAWSLLEQTVGKLA